jgi:hypothetical protein
MKPRIGSILWTDWPALLCLMSLPVIWLICAQLPFIRREGGFGMLEALAIAAALSLLVGGLLAWRIVRIQRLFARGQVVRARVTRVRIVKDQGRVEFEYDFGGVRHASWIPVYGNRRVMALQVSQEVEALVDSESPFNAILRDLYV